MVSAENQHVFCEICAKIQRNFEKVVFEYKKDEKEAEKYAKAINKGMRELEDEERKEQHEFAEMLKNQMEN